LQAEHFHDVFRACVVHVALFSAWCIVAHLLHGMPRGDADAGARKFFRLEHVEYLRNIAEQS
jgi:hypothetical protein